MKAMREPLQVKAFSTIKRAVRSTNDRTIDAVFVELRPEIWPTSTSGMMGSMSGGL